jgi:glutamine synthetase
MQVKAGHLPKKSESALDAFERNVLRRITDPMKEPSISNIIKLKRLQWASHIQYVGEKRIPESNIIGKRLQES